MKYIICFLMCSLFFAGCSQNITDFDPSSVDITWSMTSWAQNIYSGWELGSLTIISGIYDKITISWSYFVHSRLFTIQLPNTLTTWEYDGRIDTLNDIYFDNFFLTNTSWTQYFDFRTQVISPTQSTLSTKQLCHKEYMDKLLSHSSVTKVFSWKNLYIDYTKIQIHTLEKQSWTKNEARLCFVYSGMIYTLWLWWYSIDDTRTFVDSLYFY